FRVDLDDRDVRAGGPAEVLGIENVRRFEARLHAVREVVRRPRLQGDLLRRQRAAVRRERAALVRELALADLELVGCDLARLLEDSLRRVVDGDPADGEAAAAVGVHAERRDRRVAVQHLDLVVADAELIGDDLRDGRFVALTVRRRPDEDLHGSGRKEANRRSVPAAGAVADRAEDAGRSETAHLEIGREAYPELLRVATLAAPGLLLADRVVVEQLERRVEVRVVVARVDGEPRRDRLPELAQAGQPAN